MTINLRTLKVLANEILAHARQVSFCRLQKGFLGREDTASMVPRGLRHTEGVRFHKQFSRSTMGAGGAGGPEPQRP